MLNNRYVRNFTRLFCLVLFLCIIFSSCALDENEEHDTYEGTLENVSEGKNDQEITNDVDYSKLYFTKLDSTEEIACLKVLRGVACNSGNDTDYRTDCNGTCHTNSAKASCEFKKKCCD